MMARSDMQVVSLTHPGVVRSFNEDSIVADRENGIFVLADGMGGYRAGDVASGMATKIILDELRKVRESVHVPPSTKIRHAIEKANEVIFRAAQDDSKFQSMGTTVVCLLIQGDQAAVGHVGDSRLYRLRDDEVELLTYDHSLLQEQVDMGLISSEDAKVSHNRNLVTRALGVGPSVKIDVIEHEVQLNDLFLLCSDGLNDMVDDSDIGLVLRELRGNLPLMAKVLVQMANDNGGHDNVSVVLAKIEEDIEVEQHLFGKMFGWLKTAF